MNNEFNAFTQYIQGKTVNNLENIINGKGTSIDNKMLYWAIDNLFIHEIASEYNLFMIDALTLVIKLRNNKTV